MPLINVMRRIAAEKWHFAEDAVDVAISAYIQAGTLTDAERSALIGMTCDERSQWAVRRVPLDAVPALIWDFNAHGFIIPGEPIVQWDSPAIGG